MCFFNKCYTYNSSVLVWLSSLKDFYPSVVGWLLHLHPHLVPHSLTLAWVSGGGKPNLAKYLLTKFKKERKIHLDSELDTSPGTFGAWRPFVPDMSSSDSWSSFISALISVKFLNRSVDCLFIPFEGLSTTDFTGTTISGCWVRWASRRSSWSSTLRK